VQRPHFRTQLESGPRGEEMKIYNKIFRKLFRVLLPSAYHTIGQKKAWKKKN
jgi:hypothetical protein